MPVCVVDRGPVERIVARSARPVLAVIVHAELAGHVYGSENRRLVFRYNDAWPAKAGALPLSLSMPLESMDHGHQATSASLWGLLPDDPRVVAYWARLHGVSRSDVVGLLAHVGEDCAGAVQPCLQSASNMCSECQPRPMRKLQSSGCRSTTSQRFSRGYAGIPLPAVRPTNRDSSASPARSQRRRCTTTAAGGVCPRAGSRARTSSNLRSSTSKISRTTSTSACIWRASSECPRRRRKWSAWSTRSPAAIGAGWPEPSSLLRSRSSIASWNASGGADLGSRQALPRPRVVAHATTHRRRANTPRTRGLSHHTICRDHARLPVVDG